MITTIIKRDGRKVPLNMDKISEAIYKAFQVTGGKSKEEAIELANEVVGYMDHVLHLTEPSVEQIQDVVEKVLIETAIPAPRRNTSFTGRNAPGCGR